MHILGIKFCNDLRIIVSRIKGIDGSLIMTVMTDD